MSVEASGLGALERVLQLKAVPELSDVHPDDLASIAEHTSAHRLAVADALPGDEDGRCMHFLLEGSVSEPCGGGEPVRREAPAVLGALCVLAGDASPSGVAEREATTLSIGRTALLELLRDDFEVWFALLRHVCRLALEARGGAILAAAARPRGARVGSACAGLDLAERILLLRRVPVLGSLRVHVLGQVAAEMAEVAYGPGEALCEPGNTDSLHVIVEGSATRGSQRGAAVGPGSLLGFAECFAGERRHAVRARGPLRALQLTGEALIDVLEDAPDAAVDLLCALAREVLRLPREGAGSP